MWISPIKRQYKTRVKASAIQNTFFKVQNEELKKIQSPLHEIDTGGQ